LPRAVLDMSDFQVAAKSQRINIEAEKVFITESGALEFWDEDGHIIAAYSPSSWDSLLRLE
jgi:hypothetical protein